MPLITYTGRIFDLEVFDADAIVIEDIAQALSNSCRFNGHCSKFYSIAEHSVRASYICSDISRGHLLMHDSSEAYMGDVVTPLKVMMPWYIEKENELLGIIFDKFCKIPYNESIHNDIKIADKLMLSTEREEVFYFNDNSGYGWNPDYAKQRFLERFDELTSLNFFK